MRLCSLQSVRTHIVLGEPLAFSVRDAQHQLLLARGQIIHDLDQLDELFQRGALVEISEIASAVQPQRRAATRSLSTDQLPGEWQRLGDAVRRTLAAPADQLATAIATTTDELLRLIAHAPGVALSQVVRQGEGHYGVNHSIHAATACHAAARFLGWSAEDQRRAFQAALTMNLSMVDLQARLASQVSPPTTLQREAIHQHPTLSAELLEQAGVTDHLWLEAVAQHHELPDGTGYPGGLTDVGELATLLRFADVYTARLSARANRPAMSAQQAGRELHLMADSNPLAAALIKAFGVFPPGSLVRLASGELGLVVGNGEKAYHPLVATLTDTRGEPRLTPLRRDTSRDGLAVVGLLSPQSLPMRLSDERIAELISA
ncbi:HD domain-containing phosphohydrolase [Roseateles asaccharophilus]|uniref:HD-GYP domain-containing protein (C-di-GMP phosphodiesterase class II) n=1 Tax=Roseateles asaccharophilus TaxID=582607 RepID=A0ABU2A5I4_9BURK|nr:HD domain-containing phosphohydrolase [Roseateles asaccharophilus]MDR7332424.1 HD-GYP domain-containing protein (c-di-GMP phosphodiesterase class II) [Roseateles asaccharophilus]